MDSVPDMMVSVAEKPEPNGNSFMAEGVRQRRRLEMQSSVTQEPNHFDRLLDKLLVEILCRLPCSKSTTQCKCVCKRWSGLISNSSFISRFVALRIGGCVSSSNRSVMLPVEKGMIAARADNNRENDRANTEKKENDRANTEKKEMQAFAIAARMSSRTKRVDTWKGLMISLRDPILNPKSFTLSSLPCLEVGNGNPLTVVGACNDLLLCFSYESNKYDYYISNVQTKEWIVLPSPSFYYDTYIFTGFSCDPYYYFADKEGDGNHDVIVNPACRYSVVVVPYKPEASTKISAHVISSETSNQWRDVILSLPTSCRLYADSTGFVFGEMLHFICSQGIIGFDPYDDQSKNGGVIECRFVAWPSEIFYVGMLRVGVLEGRLHVSTFDDSRGLVVWVLQDYTRGEWSLKHNIALKEWIPADISPVHAFLGWVLGFHPTHSDVIYLLNGDWILSCNLSSKIVEVVAHIPTSSATLHKLFHAYPVMLPSWPTPLPTLK